jgi:NAD(P)-dependent dehydrogenase (short-subunit alcohol dehydrogenase family)
VEEELRFDGKVAIVTGAGHGLGKGYAQLLAARGARVLVNDAGVTTQGLASDESPAEEVVREIVAAGGEAAADAHSVVDAGAAIVEHALDAFGRVDVVVNNAGIAGGGGVDEIAPEDFERVFSTHFDGTLAVTRAAWRHLLAAGSGRVVNTSSASVFGGPGITHYISAKAAVFGLTRALAHEGREHGVHVNAVMPTAYTRLTAQIPDEAFLSLLSSTFPPESSAPFVAFLCHERNPFTGETFAVGGGRAARVFLAEAPGVVVRDATPEAYAARADDLLAIDGFTVPAGMIEDVIFQVEQLGAATDAARSDASTWSGQGSA